MKNDFQRKNPMFNAQDRAAAITRRDEIIHREIAEKRAEVDGKTRRLKALRLEKEATERAAAGKQ